MTIREALAEGNTVLATAGIESSSLDASLLLAEVLKTNRSSLYAASSDSLSETAFAAFGCLIKRRLAGECVAYILGRKEFYGLEFLVNPSVLVPRPDTELLVEVAMKEIRDRRSGEREERYGRGFRVLDCLRRVRSTLRQIPYLNSNPWVADCLRRVHTPLRRSETRGMYPETNTLPKQQPVLQGRVVDLCTGSGAVAIALKHQMPELEIWATDISVEALEVAKTNATRLLPPDASIHFCQGNLFDALLLPSACGPSFINYASPHAHFSLFTFHFSLVISNPPYIPTTEIAALSPEVLTEPILALDGGSDGLDLIRTIISKAPEFLCPGGMLLLEADPRQMETIANLFQLAGFVEIHVYKDFSNNERVISAKKK